MIYQKLKTKLYERKDELEKRLATYDEDWCMNNIQSTKSQEFLKLNVEYKTILETLITMSGLFSESLVNDFGLTLYNVEIVQGESHYGKWVKFDDILNLMKDE